MINCNNRSKVGLTSTYAPGALVAGIALLPNQQCLKPSSLWEFESCKAIQIQQENHCVFANPSSSWLTKEHSGLGQIKTGYLSAWGIHIKWFHTALLYHPQMLVLLGYVTLFIAVRCRRPMHLALAYTHMGSMPVSLAGGSGVAALISLQEEKSSTKGDLDELAGWRSRSRMKLYGI